MFASGRQSFVICALIVFLTLSAILAFAVFAGLDAGPVFGRESDRPAANAPAAGRDRAYAPQVTFTDSGQDLGGSVESSDVALGDVDGDGDLDAIVASYGGASKVYTNQGGDQGGTAGVFVDSGQSLGVGQAVDVALEDLDGDSDLDAFLLRGSENEVWLNQGVATGVFSQTNQVFGDSSSWSVAVGDLDGVGGPDAFVGRFGGQPSKVWFNDGSGTFADSGQALDDDSFDLALGDVDGDGDLDAFSANGADNQVWVNLGGEQDGEPGVFIDSGQLLSNTLSLSVALGDVDGDGDLDAYTGNDQADQVWINQGFDQGGTAGAFADSGQTLGGSAESSDVGLSDLDGDGDLDAFVVVYGGPNKVYVNQGFDQGGTEGAFAGSGQSLGSSNSQGLALGDLDGDGDVDAFVANWSQPDKVWLNGGERDGNGQPGLFSAGSQDLEHFAENFANVSSDLALGDLDGDGDLDAVVNTASEGSQVWVNGAEGNPEGVFSQTQVFGRSSRGDVELGDLDGDDDLDAFIVWTSFIDSSGFEIWLNGEGDDPPGVFSSGQVVLHRSFTSVALDDLDGDGVLDAILTKKDDFPQVWLNGVASDSPGVFSYFQQLMIEGFPETVALGDVDGDGDVDAVLSGYTLFVLLNGEGVNPPGAFSLSQQMSLQSPATGMALGDLDRDGDLDAFMITEGSNRILINGLLGNEGTFTDSGQRLGNANSTDVALGDLDGDGDLDAFSTTGYEEVRSQSNEIWDNGADNLGTQCLGTAASTAVDLGDLDGDGDLDALVANADGPDKVWFNGQGAFCSCTVTWLLEEIPPHAADNSDLAGSSILFSYLHLSSELQTYLDLRDELLSQSAKGRRYARLFYDHNAEMYSLLVGDAALRDEGLATLQLWQPDLQALVDGQGDSVTISAEQVQAVDDFLANLSAAASPALQQVIAEERAKLPPPEAFVGMTLEEARGIVLPDVAYLPITNKR